VAARGFLPPGANVRDAAPPTSNTHRYNKAYINDTVTVQIFAPQMPPPACEVQSGAAALLAPLPVVTGLEQRTSEWVNG